MQVTWCHRVCHGIWTSTAEFSFDATTLRLPGCFFRFLIGITPETMSASTAYRVVVHPWSETQHVTFSHAREIFSEIHDIEFKNKHPPAAMIGERASSAVSDPRMIPRSATVCRMPVVSAGFFCRAVADPNLGIYSEESYPGSERGSTGPIDSGYYSRPSVPLGSVIHRLFSATR